MIGLIRKCVRDLYCARLFNEGGIEIYGSVRFVRNIRRALQVLKERAPDHLTAVLNNAKLIFEGTITRAFFEGDNRIEISTQSATEYGDRVCAGILFHEAWHLVLRRKNGIPRTNRELVEEEKMCIKATIDLLRFLRAPDRYIRHLEAQDGTHALVQQQDN